MGARILFPQRQRENFPLHYVIAPEWIFNRTTKLSPTHNICFYIKQGQRTRVVIPITKNKRNKTLGANRLRSTVSYFPNRRQQQHPVNLCLFLPSFPLISLPNTSAPSSRDYHFLYLSQRHHKSIVADAMVIIMMVIASDDVVWVPENQLSWLLPTLPATLLVLQWQWQRQQHLEETKSQCQSDDAAAGEANRWN